MYLDEVEIIYISQILGQITNMPLFSIRPDGSLLNQYQSYIRPHPLYPDFQVLFSSLFTHEDEYGIPLVRSIHDAEYYIGIKVHSEDNTPYTLVLGPCASLKMTYNQIYKILNESQIPMVHREAIYHYYHTLPIHETQQIIHFAQLFHYLLFREHMDLSQIQSYFLLPSTVTTPPATDRYLLEQRADEKLHHNYLDEKHLMNLIKEGRPEDILRLHDTGSSLDEVPIVTKNNKIRNLKNLAITAVTLACRASIEGGMNPETAYTLSELHIQRIESNSSFHDLTGKLFEVSVDYATRVKELGESDYSRPVMEIRRYIYNHLYHKIQLKQLADHVGLNPSYVSRLFKKEVHMTITEYMLMEKVNESKKWLIHSKLPIAEICTQLNFHDQSHFIKVFKQFTGVTPKQYRLKSELQ